MNITSVNTQHKYFSKALELLKQYQLFTLLETNDITPSNQTRYNRTTIDDILREQFSLSRYYGKCTASHDYQVLKEIGICFDLQFNPKNCSSSTSNTCKNETPILYLKSSSDKLYGNVFTYLSCALIYYVVTHWTDWSEVIYWFPWGVWSAQCD